MRHVLRRHPDSRGFAAARVEVEVARPRADHLVLSYVVTGKMGDIRLPPVMPAARADELWQHTCFEAFVRAPSGAGVLRIQLCAVDAMGGLSVRRLPQRHARCGRDRRARDRGAIEPRLATHCRPRWSWIGLPDLPRDASWRLGLSAVIEETSGGKSYWALGASARQAGLPSCRLLCARTFASRAAMKFGIDRLLAEPALRAPLAGRRVALLAHPASVTRDLTHSLDALAALRRHQAHRRVRPAARPARRQAGQHDRVAGLQRSGARHSGVQPLRRGAPADRRDDGHLRRAAGRPAGPRLPHLHLHHDAALRARSGGEARQGGLGARSAQSGRAGRSKD